MYLAKIEKRIKALKSGTARKPKKERSLSISEKFDIPNNISAIIDTEVKNIQSRRVRKQIIELLILKGKEQSTNAPAVSKKDFEKISTDYYKPLNNLIEIGLVERNPTYNPIRSISKSYLLKFQMDM